MNFKDLIAGYYSKVTSDCLLTIWICICILCSGCNHSKLQNQLEANHIKAVTGKEDMVLRSVIGFADKHLSVIRTKGGTDKNLEIISTLDSDTYTTYQLPIYYLDENLFKADPRPKNLMNCMYQPDDGKLYIVTEAEKILFSMFLQQEKDEWLPNRVIWETDAWLKDLITNEQNTDFAVFYFNHLCYYTYLRNNERIYLKGEKEIPAAELCRTFSIIIKEIEEALENGEGMLFM